MGIHTGEGGGSRRPLLRAALVNHAAPLMSVAHGGQIVVSSATQELSSATRRPMGPRSTELGKHRLRDVGRSEVIFQIRHPRLRSEFLPLRSLKQRSGRLPRSLTSFVGRDRELASVLDALAHASLVTLIGVGGVGKTRLALQAAAERVGEVSGWRLVL